MGSSTLITKNMYFEPYQFSQLLSVTLFCWTYYLIFVNYQILTTIKSNLNAPFFEISGDISSEIGFNVEIIHFQMRSNLDFFLPFPSSLFGKQHVIHSAYNFKKLFLNRWLMRMSSHSQWSSGQSNSKYLCITLKQKFSYVFYLHSTIQLHHWENIKKSFICRFHWYSIFLVYFYNSPSAIHLLHVMLGKHQISPSSAEFIDIVYS